MSKRKSKEYYKEIHRTYIDPVTKEVTYHYLTPVTEETLQKVAQAGILDETLTLVQPEKGGWISEDQSEAVLERWELS